MRTKAKGRQMRQNPRDWLWLVSREPTKSYCSISNLAPFAKDTRQVYRKLAVERRNPEPLALTKIYNCDLSIGYLSFVGLKSDLSFAAFPLRARLRIRTGILSVGPVLNFSQVGDRQL